MAAVADEAWVRKDGDTLEGTRGEWGNRGGGRAKVEERERRRRVGGEGKEEEANERVSERAYGVFKSISICWSVLLSAYALLCQFVVQRLLPMFYSFFID